MGLEDATNAAALKGVRHLQPAPAARRRRELPESVSAQAAANPRRAGTAAFAKRRFALRGRRDGRLRRANPWTLLGRAGADGAVPAIVDETSLQYVLHASVGDVDHDRCGHVAAAVDCASSRRSPIRCSRARFMISEAAFQTAVSRRSPAIGFSSWRPMARPRRSARSRRRSSARSSRSASTRRRRPRGSTRSIASRTRTCPRSRRSAASASCSAVSDSSPSCCAMCSNAGVNSRCSAPRDSPARICNAGRDRARRRWSARDSLIGVAAAALAVAPVVIARGGGAPWHALVWVLPVALAGMLAAYGATRGLRRMPLVASLRSE